MTAEFRSVQTRMWREDDWFQELPTDARLLFIYLFTNPSASIAGIYRLPLRTIAFESGIALARVEELLRQFGAAKKVYYEDGVIWVVKMRDNQLPAKKSLSTPILTHLDSELAKIPACRLKNLYLAHYGYPIDENADSTPYPNDTLSIGYGGTYTYTDTYTDTVTETKTGTSYPAPEGAKPKTAKPPKPPTSEQSDMFGAIAETCELDAKLKQGQIAKTAQALIAAGYTPAQVRGFKEWWQSDDWRLEHTPIPSIAQLTTKLQQFKNASDPSKPVPVRQPSTNGNRPLSKVGSSMQAFENMRAKLAEGETI